MSERLGLASVEELSTQTIDEIESALGGVVDEAVAAFEGLGKTAHSRRRTNPYVADMQELVATQVVNPDGTGQAGEAAFNAAV
jgi:hypothetical protein